MKNIFVKQTKVAVYSLSLKNFWYGYDQEQLLILCNKLIGAIAKQITSRFANSLIKFIILIHSQRTLDTLIRYLIYYTNIT